MSNYQTLKDNLSAQIKQNGNKAITGQILQTHLLAMITSLGAGYQYMGVAALNTNPGTPDQRVFYIAAAVGTYPNFGSGLTVALGEVAIFYYDSSWHKQVTGIASKVDVDALIASVNSELTQLGQKVGGLTLNSLIDGGDLVFEQGTIVATTGANTADNTVIRSAGALPTSVGRVSVPGGFIIWRIIYYSDWTDAYTFTYSAWEGVSNQSAVLNSSYNYARILVRNSGGTAITPSDLISMLPVLRPEFDNEVKKRTALSLAIGVEKLSFVSTGSYKTLWENQGFIPRGTVVLSYGLTGPFALYFYYSAGNYESVGNSDLPYVLQHDITRIQETGFPGTVDLLLQYKAGYKYIGVASPATNPGTPTEMVYYIASNAGTYTNFGGIVISSGEYANLKWDGNSWEKELLPISGSVQLVYDNPFQDSNAALAYGNTITTPRARISKNSALSAHISGAISSVMVGVGYNSNSPYRDYDSSWLEITSSQIIAKIYRGNETTIGTYSHGLDLSGGDTTIVVLSQWTGGHTRKTTAILYDGKGGMFSQEISTWGEGRPFLTNNNTSGTLAVELSFMPTDIFKPVWLFGDSYISFVSNQRWPYYLANEGCLNWFIDSLPGASSPECLEDLQNLLDANTPPRVIVWTLGMNGGADSGGDVNAAWLASINTVISLCASHNIELVLATIPSVPSRVHEKLNQWVRNSGLRYIDFAAAVDNGNDYYWKGWGTASAMLSSDEVHPTEYGAIALASRVFVDCPELTISA